jgi:site-specific DNA-methyltransferase (adenine-specific)
VNRVVLSSERHDWATPRSFFAALHREFDFTLDVCATAENACLPRYFSPDDDALSQSWQSERCWMNPPFGYGIGKWVRKAYEEAKGTALVVALLPARTDTSWWHQYVVESCEIRFIRGRMRFSGHAINAPFPCAVVLFDGVTLGRTRYTTMDRILDEVPA